jgi:hypothetical protein
MNSPEDIASLSWEELLALAAEQQQQITQLQGQLAKATATIESLQVEVERLTREKKRQAAPFSKGIWESEPKRPGRQPGSGTFSFRQAPRPEEITEPPVEVRVSQGACPGCGGSWPRSGWTWLTFNRVERALRPAVIARKVSQCSKNQAGAYAFSAFKSVIQTLVKRRAGSIVEALYALFCSPKASWPLADPFRWQR